VTLDPAWHSRYCATHPLPSQALYRAGNLLTANYKRTSQGAILNLSPALRWPAAVRRLLGAGPIPQFLLSICLQSETGFPG